MTRTLIRNALVENRLVSVLIDGGRVVSIEEDPPRDMVLDGEVAVVDAAGGALLPGLHDHHLHLLALAARRDGTDVDDCPTPAAFDDAVVGALHKTSDAWVRIGGYDEHRHGPIGADRLDGLVGSRRVRVQHRSGLAWILSSAGLDEVISDQKPEGLERDATGRPTGWLLRFDAWSGERLAERTPSLARVGAELASLGITGVTDATPSLGRGRLELLRRASTAGELPQRLVLLGVEPGDLEDESESKTRWAQAGPAKVLIDEVRGIDIDELSERVAAHHRSGRAVAIHAVSRVETVAAVTALALAGPLRGDRIEHGSVLPQDLDTALAASGITIIVQPQLVHERGDHHLRVVDEEDIPFLHRARSLMDAGVSVAAGSDAPVTSPDPWAAIATASSRVTRGGQELGADELVDPRVALDWFLTDPLDPAGDPRRVRVGMPADLCLLDTSLDEMLSAPDSAHVRMTWVGGRLVHS